MPSKLLLDTNAVSAVMRADAAAVEVLSEAEAVYLSTVTVGELYYGAFHAAVAAAQIPRVDEVVTANDVLSPDPATARLYGQIKANLRCKGRMIPDNDLWIAALAFQHNLTVMTLDKHFADIEGLSAIEW
jgi:tRNA(fMet)-specific endonuclease VapC